MLTEHHVDLAAEAAPAALGVVGKLLVLKLNKIEEVWRIDVCKGMDFVLSQAIHDMLKSTAR